MVLEGFEFEVGGRGGKGVAKEGFGDDGVRGGVPGVGGGVGGGEMPGVGGGFGGIFEVLRRYVLTFLRKCAIMEGWSGVGLSGGGVKILGK